MTYFKIFISLILIFVSSTYFYGQNVVFNSQADVNAFPPGTTSITGSLDIITTNGSDPISDLSNLANLNSIGGDLNIRLNNALIHINDLANLTMVPGDVHIQDNALTNIDGFANLISTGGFLRIDDNPNLADVNGLANLTSTGGGLSIKNNDALTHIDALTHLTSIGDYLSIYDNASLNHIDGLVNLISIGGNLNLYDNPSLTNCCGLFPLLNTPGSISGTSNIFNNPSECSSLAEATNADCGIFFYSYTNSPCMNASNGSIQVEIRYFDETPFYYDWVNTSTGETGSGVSQSEFFTIQDLSAGTYDVTVTEANSNSVVQTGIILSEILGSVFEIIEITSTNSSNALNNGSIHLTLAGGTAPFSYTWAGPSSGTESSVNTTYTIPDLSQGTYDITVSDNDGNEQSVSISLLDETLPNFPCDQPLDIVILNDVSGSVNSVEYTESKQFFVDFLNEVNIGQGPNDSRAAIIEWSSTFSQNVSIPITGDMINLQAYLTMNRSFSGGTNPQSAMTYGEDYLANVARPGVDRVIVLATDGSPGQISPSLIALADQFKADGYHIITVAFDVAYSNLTTRDILRQVASIDVLAPGAPSYSQLDQDLAENIVNLYLCPVDPGSSTTVYFNRDGEIQITGIQPVGSCPNPDNVEITFTVEALRELSLPPGTPVSFYHNNPELFGSNPILTWMIPCAIPAGSIETFTVTLPVSTASNIYAILNDDGSQSPAISFPITDIEELAYSNNIDNISVCLQPVANIQAIKYSTTPSPICNNTVIYTVDVCNISEVDASGIVITDDPPAGFVLQGFTINDNGCAMNNGTSFDIPAECCVSITYTYDASASPNAYYNDQDVILSGPPGQYYISFDGATTTAEDVLIDGSLECPSDIIHFSKDVNTNNSCEDAFVVYTFTIENQTNIPLQGLQFTDILPSPVNWTFQPYNLQGLSVSNANVSGNTASFIIDEVEANTTASFSIDAYLGDWTTDGTLNNTATLASVPDLVNGGIQTLTSNTTSTTITTLPEITLPEILYVETSESSVTLDASITGATTITWTTIGDGSFSSTNTSETTYTFGSQDYINEEISLYVSTTTDCGEDGQEILIVLVPPTCVITIDNLQIGNCNDNGTIADVSDDTYEVLIHASVVDGSSNNTYEISDGTNILGTFSYGQDETIVLPANGINYNLTLSDSDHNTCDIEIDVSQNPCSNTCLLSIDNINIGACNDNGTISDSSDDTYDVDITANALNPSTNNTYTIFDGTNTHGPFIYGTTPTITLPADGATYTLTFTDSDDASCFADIQISQNSCSNICNITITDATIGSCNDNGTESDPSDDTFDVNVDASILNAGPSNQFTVSEGTNILGTFTYGSGGIVTLPADGLSYTLVFTDVDDSSCTTQTQVSQNSCSSTCLLSIDDLIIGNCFDNGTDSNSNDDTYEIVVTANALNPGTIGTYIINDGTNLYGPFSYGISTTLTLPADGISYTLTFTDSDDMACFAETQVYQTPCSCISDVFYHLYQPVCEGDLHGGIIIDSMVGIGPFSYSFDNDIFFPLGSFAGETYLDSIGNLSVGDYDFYIIDESFPDCIHSFSFSIDAPLPFYVDLGEDTLIHLGNSIPITMESNLPFEQLEWSWNDSSYLDCSTCIHPISTPFESIQYILEATNLDGCIASDTIDIRVVHDYNIYIPNAFSPNGDATNDLFSIYPDERIPEITNIKIFSRWGELVYQQNAYDPHANASFNMGWDGSFRGKLMNPGVFTYFVEFRLINGEQVILKGDVTLVR